MRTFDASGVLVESFLRGEGHTDEVTPPDARVPGVMANDRDSQECCPAAGKTWGRMEAVHRSHGSGQFA